MNDVNTAYDEVKRVMEFAQVMINLSSLKNIRSVGHDITEVIRREYPELLSFNVAGTEKRVSS